MSTITIEVWDATGNKKQAVEVPSDAAVDRVIAVLVDKMNLPRNSPDGQLMSYKFHHKASGRQLLESETLASANVRDGEILRLQPEITAGGSVAVVLLNRKQHHTKSSRVWFFRPSSPTPQIAFPGGGFERSS